MWKSYVRRLHPAALAGVVLGVGIIAGWFGANRERERLFAHLLEQARLAAVAFDAAEIRRLTGTRADLQSPVYAAVKQRLRSLRAVDPAVKFIYLFRSVPDTGGVIFLGDSAEPGSKDESLPGDGYRQAATSPGLQEILRGEPAATEGPLSDDFGTWNTAYALVDERPGRRDGAPVRDILGVDLDASRWTRDQWFAGLVTAAYVWLLGGLPLLALRSARQAHEQREVIRNLSEAMEQSHSALMICDLEGRIEYANRGLCQQIGFSRRELIGHSWRDFRVAETSDEMLGELVATVRSGRAWEGEWINRRKDGVSYPVRGIVTPVKHRDGSLACYIAVFDDVTEIKRREMELREARDLAQAGDRAKSQFLATMSHEVRTPLNGIVGFTDLLFGTPLSDEQREFVQTIRTSSEALIQLTGDILDYARIESGKLKLDEGPCDPRECIENSLDLMAAKAAERNIELLYRVAAEVPAAIHTDSVRLRQVLGNLIGNALKFTERGEVIVSVVVAPLPAGERSRPVEPGQREVLLGFSVQDTGIGIAPEHQPKLFKPFTQLDNSTTRRYGGTGLGLAISRNIVRLLGGDISVASEPGRGSVFTFTVRARALAPAPEEPDLSALRIGLSAAPGALRREMAALLAGWGAAVSEADQPAGLPAGTCDLVLVDLPEASARALAGQAQPLAGLDPATTFGLVPISLPIDLRNSLRSHFRLLINKPVHHQALFATLSGSRPGVPPAPLPAGDIALRVLIVEDNRVNQRLIQRVLTNLGCTYRVVDNGRLALEELARNASDYDTVLLDFHMPEMDGITALQEIRAGRAGPVAQALWIIALTADARDEQRERARAAGLNDYLTKPLRLLELEAALQRCRAELRKRAAR